MQKRVKINQKYNGTIIGIIFSVVSIGFAFTFVIPLVSVLFGVFVETILTFLLDEPPVVTSVNYTILTLILIVVIATSIMVIKGRNAPHKDDRIILYMVLMFFVLHPLGFYLYWAIDLDYKSDGQLIFACLYSFPISSVGFLPLGMLLDVTKNKKDLPFSE